MTAFNHGETILIEVSISIEDPFSDEVKERDVESLELDIIHEGTSIADFPKNLPQFDDSEGKYYYRWLTDKESEGAGHYTLRYTANLEDDVKIEEDRIALR